MSQPQKPKAPTFTKEQIEHVQKVIDFRLDQQKKEFNSAFGQQLGDYGHSLQDSEAIIRRVDQLQDTVDASNRATVANSELVEDLFLDFHEKFQTVRNLIMHRQKKKDNRPLILAIAVLLAGGIWFAQPNNQTNAFQWYQSGANAYLLWGALALIGFGYLYYRNRQERRVQTGR